MVGREDVVEGLIHDLYRDTGLVELLRSLSEDRAHRSAGDGLGIGGAGAFGVQRDANHQSVLADSFVGPILQIVFRRAERDGAIHEKSSENVLIAFIADDLRGGLGVGQFSVHVEYVRRPKGSGGEEAGAVVFR